MGKENYFKRLSLFFKISYTIGNAGGRIIARQCATRMRDPLKLLYYQYKIIVSYCSPVFKFLRSLKRVDGGKFFDQIYFAYCNLQISSSNYRIRFSDYTP